MPPYEAWIELPDQSTFVLAQDCHFGRIAGNEIVNPDSRISRRHAVVRREGNHFVLVDLGSTNGTCLNGVKISKPARLKDGDQIVLGTTTYTFCQPRESTELDGWGDSTAGSTVVVVGKVSCWMLLAVAPAGESAWLEQIRQKLASPHTRVKQLAPGTLLAHWRDRGGVIDEVRKLVLDLSQLPVPSGARLVLHCGAVRVGPGSTPGEETLLGADVAFVHRLEAMAASLGLGAILSEAAAQALGLAPKLKSLGSKTVPGLPGEHALHTFSIAP